MYNVFFIIGMRRSGTSLLRQLIHSHPDTETIEFEPHELMFVVQTEHIPRYSNSSYHKEVLDRFKKERHGRLYGAKFALNAGIEAMNWKWLDKKFFLPKYIFIQRGSQKTYQSWVNNETSVRGVCPYLMYYPWWKHINLSFEMFVIKNKNRAVVVNYENLCQNTDKTMNKVWDILKIPRIEGLNSFIKKEK